MSETHDDFACWLPEARAGSREALGQALEACRQYLLLIADRAIDPGLQAKGGASDLVQQTFLEAQQAFAQFQGSSPEELRAWLRCLLLNNVVNFARHHRGAAKRDAGRECRLGVDSSGGDPGGGLADSTVTPSVEAMAREQEEAVRRALERLPEDYRQAILLRHQEQRSFEEIGRILQRSPNAARLLWLRAVERLQLELGVSP
jgi:RNA polymerase sigma-70 factor (ECF subfamily)